MKRFFGLLILMLACYVAPARAWNCNNPLDARVDVGTTKPSGSAGDGDGQYFLGTGSEGTKGDYYVCQTPKPPTDPTTSGQKQKQQQTSNSSSASNSNSSASNTLKNRVTATGGNSSSTSTGGSASLSNSGNSTLSNSGNSSNTNTNSLSAQGGQGGTATSNTSSASSAANNGNGSNNTSYNSETNIAATKIPVDTAYAPTTIPTVPCFKTYSGGAQTSAFGISLGGGKVDENCAILETARSFDAAGETLAACKVKISNKYAKNAGVSLEDCLTKERKFIVLPAPTPAPQPLQPTIIIVPAPVAAPAPLPTPVITTTTTQRKDFPNCSIPNGSILTNICKAELRDAARAMVGNPGAVLHIAAPQYVVSAVKSFLGSVGVQHGVEWGIFDGQNNNLTLSLTWTEEVR